MNINNPQPLSALANYFYTNTKGQKICFFFDFKKRVKGKVLKLCKEKDIPRLLVFLEEQGLKVEKCESKRYKSFLIKDKKESVKIEIKNMEEAFKGTKSLENKIIKNKEIAFLIMKDFRFKGNTCDTSWIVNSFSDELKNDTEIMKEAVRGRYNGNNIKYGSNAIRSNKEIALIAVGNYENAYNYLSSELKNDYDILIETLKTGVPYKFDFKSLKEEFLNDPKIALYSVRYEGINLKFFSDEIKHNLRVVLSAIYNDNSAIEFVGEKIKKDRELIEILESIKEKDERQEYPM